MWVSVCVVVVTYGCVCMGFVIRGYVMCGCFDNCVRVLVICVCVLVFTAYFIVWFMYIFLICY
jgi:hypothetical protein